MKKEKSYFDVEDLNAEFTKINKRSNLLLNRFIAIGLDYQHFIDNRFGQKEVYEIRDNLNYRLSTTKHQLNLLLREELGAIEQIRKLRNESNRPFTLSPLNIDKIGLYVSSTFDSLIFHTCSIFDYLGNLSNFICGDKKPYKWSSLAKAARDKNHPFNQKGIASTIFEIDRDFVGKLYQHRSNVIHEKPDYFRVGSTDYIGTEKFEINISVSQRFCKNFADLKELHKIYDISAKYAAFWILNEAISNINRILFSLRDEMKENPKVSEPLFRYKGQDGKMLPVSAFYWNDGIK